MPRRPALTSAATNPAHPAAVHAQSVRLIDMLYDRAAYAPTEEFNEIMGLVEELRQFTGMHVVRARAPIQASAQNAGRTTRLVTPDR